MRAPGKGQGNKIDPAKTDITATLSDVLLQRILLAVPSSSRAPCALVCHRWLKVLGGLLRTLRLRDWDFLESGRLTARFPSLTDVDLTFACTRIAHRSSFILLTLPHLVVPLSPHAKESFSLDTCLNGQQLQPEAFERGLAVLASGCPDLQRLCMVDVSNHTFQGGTHSEWEDSWSKDNGHKINNLTENSVSGGGILDLKGGESKKEVTTQLDSGLKGSSFGNQLKADVIESVDKVKKPKDLVKVREESGLFCIARGCPLLQELEVHQCSDDTLTAVAAFQNVQILRLVGAVPGFCQRNFTDVGLTIIAQRCTRLVKLELSGCEASFDGIAAIGQCCQMLEELTLSSRGFQDGWLAALAYCQCLKTLRLESSKFIDRQPGPPEYLKRCATLERLQLVCCDVRDRVGFAALMSICVNIKELEFQDCWGLDDDIFGLAISCRRLRLLSLEGCSLLSNAGLEQVLLACKDIQRLRVDCCDSIRADVLSVAFGERVMSLKEFRWRPDTKSVLALNLAGTGVGQKGGRFLGKP